MQHLRSARKEQARNKTKNLSGFKLKKIKTRVRYFVYYVCYTLGNHGTELKTDGHDLLRMSGVPMLAGIE